MTRHRPPALLGSLALAVVLSACQTATVAPSPPNPPRRTAPALGPTSSVTVGSNSAGIPITLTPSLAPLPTPSSRDWQRGPASAPVTLVAYMDFQCAPCNAAARSMVNVFERHPEELRQVYRPFPLSTVEDKADLAAELADAAGRQGAFWPVHDLLVEKYDVWQDMDPDRFRTWAIEQAQAMGLDPEALKRDLDDPTLANQIRERYAESQASGIPGVPFVLLNGRPFLLAGDEIQLEAAVRLGILQARQSAVYPAVELQPGKDYLARLRTNRGEIQIQLYPDTAPMAVASFVTLAQQGWYVGAGAYQVVPGQWVGLGDPSWTGLGDAGYHYAVETDAERNFDRAGMVGIIPTESRNQRLAFLRGARPPAGV